MIVPAAALVLGLAALRAHVLRVSPAGTLLAVLAIALCMAFRSSAAYEPAAWILTACLVLSLDSEGNRQWWAIAIVSAWMAALGTASVAALIVVLHAAGTLIDEPEWNYRTLRETLLAATACAVATISPPWLSAAFTGLRVLYLDSLAPGTDRFLLWSSPVSAVALGVLLVVIVAAARGMTRPHRACGGALFAGLFVLALVDARMAPFFAIAAAPLVMRAVSVPSFVVRARSPLIAAMVFTGAILVGVQATNARRETVATALLIRTLDRTPGTHHVLCVHPTWCASIVFPRDANAVFDAALQAQLLDGAPSALATMRDSKIDAIVADADMPIAGLLRLSGDWIVAASDAGTNRILLFRQGARL